MLDIETLIKELKKGNTSINEPARIIFAITRDEYALCSFLHYRQGYPTQTKPGWCCDRKEDIARFVGISRPGLYKMVDRLESEGLLEADPATGFLRTTVLFIDTENDCEKGLKTFLARKQSLQGSVNKVYSECKQSLQGSVNKVTVNKEYESKSKSKPDKENENLSADEKPAASEPQKPKKEVWSKQAATLFDTVAGELHLAAEIDYQAFNWRAGAGRQFASLKRIRTALKKDVQVKQGHEATEDELSAGFEFLFRYGFRYLQKITKEKGGVLQFTPAIIENCYNQILQYARQEHNIRSTKTAAANQPAPVVDFWDGDGSTFFGGAYR